MAHSSKIFYENKLKAHHSVAKYLLFPEDSPLAFIDTAGCSFDEKLEGTSSTNPDEAAFLVKHLSGFVEELKKKHNEALGEGKKNVSKFEDTITD